MVATTRYVCVYTVCVLSMHAVCSAHWWIDTEEFSPGPFLQGDRHSIQDLQLGQTQHYRWSVERMFGHLEEEEKKHLFDKTTQW